MSIDKDCFNTSINLKDWFEDRKYKTRFAIEHPEYFNPDGLVVFCGGQGAGKTLSAVRYIDRLCKKYPAAILVSNIFLNIPSYTGEVLPYEGITEVAKLNNGYSGIICFIDEIQTEFNSLESAKIHPSVIQTISQQRKRRLHVIGTTQLFKRLAKPWREQCNVCVDCSLIAGVIQRNSFIDFGSIAEDSDGNLSSYDYSGHSYWFRAPRYYEMYNTFERVSRKGGGK